MGWCYYVASPHNTLTRKETALPVTAARALSNLAVLTSDALPQVGALRDLYKRGNNFRRGAVTLIAGQPASGKSMFTLWLCDAMNIDALYFSADSDAATQLSRMAAARTGQKAGLVRDQMSDPEAIGYYSETVSGSRISFCFHSSPGADTIEDELSAYVELYDKFPDVIVVDNVLDFYSDKDSETSAAKHSLLYMKEIARDTHSALFALHHVKEGSSEPGKPGSLKSTQGMVNQTPAAVYTVARDGDQFMVAPVKDRFGDDDKSGETYVTLKVDMASCSFEYQMSLAERWPAAVAATQNPGVSPAEEGYYQ